MYGCLKLRARLAAQDPIAIKPRFGGAIHVRLGGDIGTEISMCLGLQLPGDKI